jgi:hypothetical protein
VLFTIGSPNAFDSARIAVLDLKSRKYRVVATGGSSARYVFSEHSANSGHIVYVRGGTLFGVPFDLKRLKALRGGNRWRPVELPANSLICWNTTVR